MTTVYTYLMIYMYLNLLFIKNVNNNSKYMEKYIIEKKIIKHEGYLDFIKNIYINTKNMN